MFWGLPPTPHPSTPAACSLLSFGQFITESKLVNKYLIYAAKTPKDWASNVMPCIPLRHTVQKYPLKKSIYSCPLKEEEEKKKRKTHTYTCIKPKTPTPLCQPAFL